MHIFIKTTEPPYAKFEADIVHNHIKSLITFELLGEIIAQANRDAIEYWCVVEEPEDDD